MMEGTLRKWTNIVNGWQSRWFALNYDEGVLAYYTNFDKQNKGDFRNCIRIKGAQLGIDDDDEVSFTIAVDNKTFYLQARDFEERQKWLEVLQECRNFHSMNNSLNSSQANAHEFDRRIAEADKYLQLLIDNERALLDSLSSTSNSELSEQFIAESIKSRFSKLTELIKQSIVCLQIAKQNSLTPLHNIPHFSGRMDEQSLQSQQAQQLRNSPLLGLPTSCTMNAPHLQQNSSALQSPDDEAGNHDDDVDAACGVDDDDDVIASSTAPHLIAAQSETPAIASSSSTSNGGGGLKSTTTNQSARTNYFPLQSYASSDEEFFDTQVDFKQNSAASPTAQLQRAASSDLLDSGTPTSLSQPNLTECADLLPLEHNTNNSDVPKHSKHVNLTSGEEERTRAVTPLSISTSAAAPQSIFDEDIDEEYLPVEELDSVKSEDSVIRHLLGQVRLNMDLTRITLPTFILEKRSILEMYADFLAHADIWLAIPRAKSPAERIAAVLRWYLSAFHASRRSQVAKKPYNPILGEVFQCYFEPRQHAQYAEPPPPNARVGADEEAGLEAQVGPCPWAPRDSVRFIAEQVSHHPPIAAFYAEHAPNGISIGGHLWTKSSFLGVSIRVELVGEAVITLHQNAGQAGQSGQTSGGEEPEQYVITFPSVYCRNILTTPWLELVGAGQIACAKTGFNGVITFRSKGVFSKQEHRLKAELFAPGEKKPFLVSEGAWNGTLSAEISALPPPNSPAASLNAHALAALVTSSSDVLPAAPPPQLQMHTNNGATHTLANFVDTTRLPLMRKLVRARRHQREFESRRLWQRVTLALKRRDIAEATRAKCELEEQQRADAKQRAATHTKWTHRKFRETGNHWVYTHPLINRDHAR